MGSRMNTIDWRGLKVLMGDLEVAGSSIWGGKPRGRKTWYVDAKRGNDNNDGFNWDNAKATVGSVFTASDFGSGDTIWMRGKVREELTTPAGVFDVTVIGAGNRPRHADDHTESGNDRGSSSATWTSPASPTAATPLLIVQQQGWKFIEILFDGPSDAAAVQLFRDGGAGDAERDASHAHFYGCKFVAGQNHIEFKGGLSQVRLEDNTFFGATGASIVETVGAGIGTNNYHEFLGNRWKDNATNIDMGCNDGMIIGNVSGNFTGKGFDFTTGGSNAVHGNYLWGDYDAGYVAGTSDDWCGNFTMDITSGEVGDNGVTVAAPVA